MRMKHYFDSQNDRWHEQYLESEKLLCEAESALCQLEHLALQHISDEVVRAEIAEIADRVWRITRD